jgi:hypothetical protein
LDVAVWSNYTGSSKWQGTPHESSRASTENSQGTAFGGRGSVAVIGHFPSFLRDSETQPKPVFQAGGRG